MKRREFITALGGAAAWPLAVRAQQTAMPVIGYIGSSSPDLYADRLRVFRQGLNENGYVEGRNVAIEFRWAESHFDRLPGLVADLVHRPVSLIAVAGSTSGALAAKTATATIPIVFGTAGDPVELGLVASWNRPGGNLTGVTLWNAELVPKRLELLHELVPTATEIALLVNPTSPIVAEIETKYAQTAAHARGLQLHILNASTKNEIEAALAILAQRRIGALLVGADTVFFENREHPRAILNSPCVFRRSGRSSQSWDGRRA
jgi:putative tryptophan/tyrosine transport system substrate-binding protein